MSILSGLVDKKMLAVLQVFFDKPKELLHIQQVATLSHIPLATTFRIMHKLAKLNILEIVPVGNLKLYRLAKSKKTKTLRGML